MNKQRRNRIEKVIGTLDGILEVLNDLECEEQQALDNLPESFQESERGERMQEIIDYLSDAASSIEEAEESLNSAIE